VVYWLIKHLLLGPWLFTVFRPWVRGIDGVPSTGPVIFASNHLSFSDSIFLPLVVDRPIRFLAKSEYVHRIGIARLDHPALHALGRTAPDGSIRGPGERGLPQQRS